MLDSMCMNDKLSFINESGSFMNDGVSDSALKISPKGTTRVSRSAHTNLTEENDVTAHSIQNFIQKFKCIRNSFKDHSAMHRTLL